MLKTIGLVLSVVASFTQGAAPPPVRQGKPTAVSAPPATARQGTAALSGIVSRVDNEKPVPAALVQLQRMPASRDNPALLVRTDDAGAYRFEKLPPAAIPSS